MTTVLRQFKSNNRNSISRKNRGFTLTEVLVSGGMFSMVMAGVAQIMTGSLAASSATAQRQQIESAINNNIQYIHQANIQLAEELNSNAALLTEACAEPTLFLADELEDPSSPAYVAAPLAHGESSPQAINRSIYVDPSLGLTQVVYQFEGPEQNVETEQRVVDLFPQFIAQCPLSQLSRETDDTSTNITPSRSSSNSNTDPQNGEPRQGGSSTTDPQNGDPRPGDSSSTDPQNGEPKKDESSTTDPQNGDPRQGGSSSTDPQTGEPKKDESSTTDPQNGEPKKDESSATDTSSTATTQSDPDKTDKRKGKKGKGRCTKRQRRKGKG